MVAGRRFFRFFAVAGLALCVVTALLAEDDPSARPVSARFVTPGDPAGEPKFERSAGPVDTVSGIYRQKVGRSHANVVADPSFETGTPNPFWSEASSPFGTPLCSFATCGVPPAGNGPRTGDWWAAFFTESASLSQDVSFDVDATELTFWLEVPICDSSGGVGHFMQVRIDGTRVFRVDATSPVCGAVGYSRQRIDVSAWADGGTHTVEILAQTGATLFSVDDVGLVTGLAAYWPFDGDARDHSGNGNHGTLEGPAGFGPGVVGDALDLRAGDGFVDVASPVLDGADECSIAYWVSFESLVPADPSDPLSAIFTEDFFDLKALHNHLAFWTDPDTLEWHISGNERASSLAPTSAPVPWTHLAMVYSSFLARSEIYVNGALAAIQEHAAPQGCGAGSPSQIGAWFNGSEHVRHLDGRIDDLRIYSRTLTASEVAGLAMVLFADGFESGDLSAW